MSAWGNTDAQASKPVAEATTFTIDSTSTDVVNTTDDTINIKHGFSTGDAVVYTTAGTAIGGLASGTTYYIIAGDSAADTEHDYQLAASASDATAGTEITLTAVGDTATDTIQILAADIYGVDTNEMAANKTQEGAAHAGWNKVTTIGSRKVVETLVAMSKNFASATDAEDTVFEDYLITIDTQPADDSTATGGAVTFTVAASITGSGGTLTYQWQEDSGSGFANITEAGVYSDVTTVTLAISDNTGLDTNQYRCVVSATGADDVTSDAATLTEA